MIRKALMLAIAAALIAIAGGTGRAHAAGGTFRITVGGDQNWAPETGGLDQTASGQLEASGTMTTTEQRSGTNGSADYHIASGPGIARAQIAGSFTTPSGLSYPFNPSLQAVSTTELTINAPDDLFVNTTVNIHVDGIILAPVCGDLPTCGAENVFVSVGPFQRTAEFDTFGGTRANDLGLALDPVPGGYRVHGDVTSSTLGIRTNTPFPVTLVLNVSGRYGSGPSPTTLGGDFDDRLAMYQVSFAPSGPVLNDIPAGYTVSGPSVVDNHWTDPFAPASGDVVVTSCTDPVLAGLTTVHGNLILRNISGCPAIAMPSLTEVTGDLIVENVDADLDLGGVTVGGAIDVSGTGGDLTIEDNSVGEAIDVGGSTGGDLTVTDNGDALVNAAGSTSIGGDLDISTGSATVSAVTADGTTEVELLNGAASMHAVLPAGAFDRPVGFSVAYSFDDPPENGVDPIATYHFAFDVPVLSSPARLTFTIDLSQLDAAGRATLLNALASGNATIVGKSDAAGSTYTAFPVCTATQTPEVDGCVAVTTDPGLVRFDGVVGHFSSYAVATVTPPRDTTAPTITVPADITVDATRPAGATVSYTASASDDRDPAPKLVCAPASGSTFAIGTTHVSCTATDASGNTAQSAFDVHVRGAAEQIVRLINKTLAYLDLPGLRSTFVVNRPQAACFALDLYVLWVRLAPAKAFTPAEKSDLIADATRIKAVIGCR